VAVGPTWPAIPGSSDRADVRWVLEEILEALNSPWPVVPPNARGARSDMSNRNTWAFARAVADRMVIGSGYAVGSTFLLGEEKPPA